MRFSRTGFCLLLGVFLLVPPLHGATASDEATITAYAETEMISVEVVAGAAIDYGAVGLAETTQSGPVEVRNQGTTTIALSVRGASATSTAGSWVLADSPGADTYAWALVDVGHGITLHLADSAQQWLGSLAPAETATCTFDLRTPTAVSSPGKYSMQAYIIATAP
jgi:hypothetical protein